MSDERMCIGVDASRPCGARSTEKFVIPVCSDHKAALFYQLEEAGFVAKSEPPPPPLSTSDRECYTSVGRDIVGAILAYHFQVTHRTAMKRVPEEIGESWILLARDLCEGMIEDLDRRMDMEH